MEFDQWWNSAAADSYRADHPEMDGRDVEAVWNAALALGVAPWRMAFNNTRDAVLYERGPLDGEGTSSGSINAVLAILENEFAGLLA